VQIGREAAPAEGLMEPEHGSTSAEPSETLETEPSALDREARTSIGWMSAARSRINRRGWPPLELAGDGLEGVSVVVIEERMNRRGCRAHHSFWCSRRVFFASFDEDLGHEVHICGDGLEIRPGSERFG